MSEDKNLCLQVPLDNQHFLCLRAEEGEAAEFLHTLADVTGIACSQRGDGRFCRAVLASENLPPEVRGPHFRRLLRDNETIRILFPERVSENISEREVILLRGLLCCAITYENLYAPGDFALFHGSLLEDGKDAVLLFGESGIGKSTTRNRWIEEGGTSVADDAMLCFFDGDQLYARPLPTWSDWFKNGSSSRRYPINEPRKIKSVLWLSRGRDSQYIAPVQPAVWHAQMMSAMALHSNYAMRYFTQQEKSAYLEHIWSLICRIDKIFQPRGLFAHLDFPLKPTLAQEFSK